MRTLKFDSKKKPGMTMVIGDNVTIGMIFKVKNVKKYEESVKPRKLVTEGSYIFLGIKEGKGNEVPTFNLPTYLDVKKEVIRRFS